MITHRLLLLSALVGLGAATWGFAQDSGGETAPAESSAESSESAPADETSTSTESSIPSTAPPPSETTDTAPGQNPFADSLMGTDSTNPFSSDSGASSSFGTSPSSSTETKEDSAADTGGGGGIKPDSASGGESFSAPGLYGSGGVNFTSGSGRFARPKFRYRGSVGIGYDDNYLLAPDNPVIFPERTVTQTFPEQPEIAVLVTRKQGQYFGGNFIGYKTTTEKVVLRPAIPEQSFDFVIPEVRTIEKEATMIGQTDLQFNVQWVKPRTLFTFDLNANAAYYLARKFDPVEYNGTMAYVLVHRYSPKLQFSTTGNLSYLSQPDYSSLTGSTLSNSGSYVSGSVKFDATYKWLRRLSTVTSLSFNTLMYEEETRATSNYLDSILGTELRYLWSPRLTTVGEVRYSQLDYPDQPLINSSTMFLLLGADWRYSRHLTTVVRLGEALRTFELGETQSTPYVEMNIAYQPGRRTKIDWSNRYGFEQAGGPTQQVTSVRSNLGIAHAFSPRLSGRLGVNYLGQTITSEGVEQEAKQQFLDGSMNLEYMVNRHFALSLRYSYTQRLSDESFGDFYRNRIFLNATVEY